MNNVIEPTEMTPIQQHYRADEVAKLLGVSKWTVYRLVKAGRLKFVKVGKRARGVPEDSLRAHMQGGNEK
jgi:excisionase family DNA binding protein